MPIDTDNLGPLLRTYRQRARLSQFEAARRSGVSTRLWSETERGERPHVSATTLIRMLAEVGVALEPRDVAPVDGASPTSPPHATEAEIAALREDLRQAADYGVDLSLIRASLDKTPLQRLRENDEALAFFDGITVAPGWPPSETPAIATPGRGVRGARRRHGLAR